MTLVIDNVPSYVTFDDVREYIQDFTLDLLISPIVSEKNIADPSRKYPGSLYVYAELQNLYEFCQKFVYAEKEVACMIQGKYWGNQIVEAYYTTHEPNWKRRPRFIYPKSSQLWSPPSNSSPLSSSSSSSLPLSSSPLGSSPLGSSPLSSSPLSSSPLSSSPLSSSRSSSSSSSKPSSSSSKPTGGQIAVGVLIGIGVITFLGVIMGFPVQIVITILGGIIGVAIAFNH